MTQFLRFLLRILNGKKIMRMQIDHRERLYKAYFERAEEKILGIS